MVSTTTNERYVCLIIENDEEAYWQLKVEREQIEDEIGASLIWLEPEETRGGNKKTNTCP